MLRSSYYALGYAANDVVLIVLWLLASLTNSGYLPVAVNFIIFFLMICTALSVGKSAKFCKLNFSLLFATAGIFVSAALRHPIAKRPPARYNGAK